MPKISIVCPVYNVGQYIAQFLASLEKQTFQDFEVIFVYDESNDDSLRQIENFCNKALFKNRTKIILNKEKKGAGYARDLGFQNSNPSSEYLIFLDSDDYFDDDYFEVLINKAEETESDIVCCGYSRISDEDDSLLCKEMVNNPTGTVDIANLSFPLFLINTSVWNKLFRRAIADKCKFGYAKRAEDLYYFLDAIANSKTISFINESKYTYLIHHGSLINTMSYDKYQDTCKHFLDYTKYRGNKQLFDLMSSFIFVRIGIGTTIRVCQSKEKQDKEIIKESKSYLKEHFNIFKKNKYLSFGFLSKSGKKGLAIWILKILYKLNMFGLAVKIYIHRMKKNKKEIRW